MKPKHVKTTKKSSLKAAGVKGTFMYDGQLLMTSFGKAEEARLEKVIQLKAVTFEETPPIFSVGLEAKKINVVGANHIKAVLPNPTLIGQLSATGQLSKRQAKRKQRHVWLQQKGIDPSLVESNYKLRQREALEKLYFGATFSQTFNIQIIYNILDISKILSVYINNLTFIFNNLMQHKPLQDDREDSDKDDDIISKAFGFSYDDLMNNPNYNEKKQLFLKFLGVVREVKKEGEYPETSGYLFGQAFIQKILKTNGKTDGVLYRSDKDIFVLIKTLSFLRNDLVHFHNDPLKPESVYRIETYPRDVRELLARLYEAKVKEVNESFLTLNSRNFSALFQLFGVQNDDTKKRALTKRFYQFSVKKDQLNLGFSLKKLREQLLMVTEASVLTQKNFDTIRGKLYTFLDFVILEKAITPEWTQKIVNELRACEEVEGEAKDKIYATYAQQVWPLIRSIVMDSLIRILTPLSFKNQPPIKMIPSWIDEVMAKSQAHPFTQLMFAYSLFLDGKDQNDMLTLLINKFSEISSLQNLKQRHQDRLGHLGTLQPAYAFFEKGLQVISDELRFVKAIVKMDIEPIVNRKSRSDALRILGFTVPQGISETDYISQFFKDDFKKQGFSNFINNNVVKSRRFLYIIKYSQPQYASMIGHNFPIMTYILSRVPESQINRHYQLQVGPGSGVAFEEKVKYLAKKLTSIRLEQFLNVNQKARFNSAEMVMKESYKQLIGLYLTCIYLFYKHMVQINARYVMAFHALERDTRIHHETYELQKSDDFKSPSKLWALVDDQLKTYQMNATIQGKMNRVKTNVSAKVIRIFRNEIAHLNLMNHAHEHLGQLKHIPKTYFALFHTLLQYRLKGILETTTPNQTIKPSQWLSDALNTVIKFSGYSKQILWALMSPIAYNKARYHSLVMEKLFDMNEVPIAPKP
jgi:hypothetical protein